MDGGTRALLQPTVPSGWHLRRGQKDFIKMDVRAPVSPHPAAYAKLLNTGKDAGGFPAR